MGMAGRPYSNFHGAGSAVAGVDGLSGSTFVFLGWIFVGLVFEVLQEGFDHLAAVVLDLVELIHDVAVALE